MSEGRRFSVGIELVFIGGMFKGCETESYLKMIEWDEVLPRRFDWNLLTEKISQHVGESSVSMSARSRSRYWTSEKKTRRSEINIESSKKMDLELREIKDTITRFDSNLTQLVKFENNLPKRPVEVDTPMTVQENFQKLSNSKSPSNTPKKPQPKPIGAPKPSAPLQGGSPRRDLTIWESLKDTPTYDTASGPNLFNIQIQNAPQEPLNLSLSSHLSPERKSPLKSCKNDMTLSAESIHALTELVPESPLYYLLRRHLVQEIIDTEQAHTIKHRILTGSIITKEILDDTTNTAPKITQVYEKNCPHHQNTSNCPKNIIRSLKIQSPTPTPNILYEQLIDSNSKIQKNTIKGWLRYDETCSAVVEEDIPDNDAGSLQRRVITGTLRLNDSDSLNPYKIIEEFAGRKRKIVGSLRVGILKGRVGLLEIEKNSNDQIVGKRKVNGTVKVFPDDGLKLMEIFDNNGKIEDMLDCTEKKVNREVRGKVRVVDHYNEKFDFCGRKVVEEYIDHTGARVTKNIDGELKFVGRSKTGGLVEELASIRFQTAKICEWTAENGFGSAGKCRGLLLEYYLGDSKILKQIMIHDAGKSGCRLERWAGTGEKCEVFADDSAQIVRGVVKVYGKGETLRVCEEGMSEVGLMESKDLSGYVRAHDDKLFVGVGSEKKNEPLVVALPIELKKIPRSPV
jgi:hypothetical protein